MVQLTQRLFGWYNIKLFYQLIGGLRYSRPVVMVIIKYSNHLVSLLFIAEIDPLPPQFSYHLTTLPLVHEAQQNIGV